MTTKKQRRHPQPITQEGKKAFERLQPEMEQLAPEQLVRVNTDLADAATVVLAAIPRIAELAPSLRRLPDFDMAIVDGLPDRANAAMYLDALLRSKGRAAPPELAALLEEAIPVRRALLQQVEQMAKWKLFPAEQLPALSSGRSARDVERDLRTLALVVRRHWDAVAAPLTQQVLDRAESLAAQIVDARAHQAPGRKGALDPIMLDLRARAFTLLVRAYDEVRRSVLYVRWSQGDAAQIAPTLYVRRGRTRKNGAAAEGEDESGGAPAVSTPAVSTTGPTSTPAAPTSGATPPGA
jgi:hypothetical protein